MLIKCLILAGWWWHTPLIPALRRKRQADLCEFEASLVYRVSSRTGSKATEKPCLKKQNTKQNKQRNPHKVLQNKIKQKNVIAK